MKFMPDLPELNPVIHGKLRLALYRTTEAGREALTEYVCALRQLLGAAIEI
jgi:DNA-binding PadR family transcriptional regulator